MAGRDVGIVTVGRGFPGFKFRANEQARVREFFSGNPKKDLREAKNFAKTQRALKKKVAVRKINRGPLGDGYAVVVEL